ncbi:MAG: hypothetical protein WC838_06305 [Candidatus Margulisiibacteriota bacterium]|jgi:hypothetical protein
MKINKTWLVSISLALLAIYCFAQEIDREAYMKPGTPEYKSLTKKILGTWKVSSLVDKSDQEKIPDTFQKGKVSFSPTNNEVSFQMTLADSVISANLENWRKNKPELEVTAYDILCTANWTMVWDNPGSWHQAPRVYLVLKDPQYNITIAGTGNVEALTVEELLKYTTLREGDQNMTNAETDASNGDWGNLMGGVMGQLVAKTAANSVFGSADYLYVLDTAGPLNEPKVSGNVMTWWHFSLKKK